MNINLGFTPLSLMVSLASGGDFVAALVYSRGWPAGIDIQLVLSGGSAGQVTWNADIDGSRASWDVPAADVQELIDTQVSTARLVYTEADGTALLWAKGVVRVY